MWTTLKNTRGIQVVTRLLVTHKQRMLTMYRNTNKVYYSTIPSVCVSVVVLLVNRTTKVLTSKQCIIMSGVTINSIDIRSSTWA